MHGTHSHDIMPMKDIYSLTNTGIHTSILTHGHRQADSVLYPTRQGTNMTQRDELPNVYTHPPRHDHINIFIYTHTWMYSHI